MFNRFFSLLALGILLIPSAAAPQEKASVQAAFETWLESVIWPTAQQAGIHRDTFEAALGGTKIKWDLPNIVLPGQPADPTEFQAEFRPPARYFEGDSLEYTASLGRTLNEKYADILGDIQRETGVRAEILLTIWGRESSFGKASIPFNAFEILSTKGFLDPRADYFTDQLIAALQIVEQGHMAPSDLKSSWAGALGQPQFMPSNFLALGADGDGDGRVDIWSSEADTLASIAAFLQRHGWVAGQSWGAEVTLPIDTPCDLEGPDRGQQTAQWRQLGITTPNGAPLPQNTGQRFLLLPAGRYGPAFIVSKNFYVLKDYNESDVYALFVGHVADRISLVDTHFHTPWQPLDPMSRGDIIALQTALEARGYDVGGVDGLIGYKTRRAIGHWQAQNALEQTCYPNQATLTELLE